MTSQGSEQTGYSRAAFPSYFVLPRLRNPPPTILDFLDRRFPHVGRGVWIARLERGEITDDRGEAIAPLTPYQPQLRLRYFREVVNEPVVPFEENIIYLDEHLLVADKPHFLPVTPCGRFVNECLLYRLRRKTGKNELVPLHRLDKETAGLVMFSVTKDRRNDYYELFRRGEVEKEYEAIAGLSDGFTGEEWLVESRIVEKPRSFMVSEEEGPVNARTVIRLVERRGRLGRFLIRPLTGKRHQVRVHMCRIGVPIVNDGLYPCVRPPKQGFDAPLLLVARRLRFRDPVDGVLREFETRRELEWPTCANPNVV
ncbi:MAG: pseudouridine synthase [Kiritimatiellae bacterium]|nr:pseudouridine synthase [Kiritimatiellia bacterium]